MIAWAEVPREPSSEDTSDELAVSVGAGAVNVDAAAAETKAAERVEETKLVVVVVDIGRGRATYVRTGEGRREEGGKNGQRRRQVVKQS